MLGTTEIFIIAGVVLVLFGGAAIPRFARSLGKARKEFEKGVQEGAQEAGTDDAREKKGDQSAPLR